MNKIRKICFLFSYAVIINEIAWMGTEKSYNDEWIELYNNSDTKVNLEKWVLRANDGNPDINLSGTIPEKSFYVLEKTGDSTLPEIKADLIYVGTLNNQGESLKLSNDQGIVVDQVNCADGWIAGDNKTKQTMERNNSGWQNSKDPNGTPGTENSLAEIQSSSNLSYSSSQIIKLSEAEPRSISAKLIALITAVFSAITIVFLARKIRLS